jgi:4-amino-4-deoxy-L-arabinose transferase-like glycosyltransferase
VPPGAPPDPRAWRLGLGGVALVTLWRLAWLPFDARDLFVDEAQYWFWGRELAWGYYSKPPLIGWLMRLSTAIGSDDAFWLRAPLPLIHAATAVVVGLVGRRLYGDRVGGVAAAGFASLPGVAVGSLLVSTDTPMLLAFALATLAWVRLTETCSAAWAVVLGAALGVGLLSKYAMVYFVLCALLVVAAVPSMRIGRRNDLIAVLVALAVVAPNLAWNAANDFATMQHTASNADFRGVRLDLAGLAEFVLGQFAVAGPVFFAAYLVALFRDGGTRARFLALMSLPVFLVVSAQALVSGANANWAAAGHLAALVLAAALLAPRPRWLALGLAINLAVSAALPVAAAFADRWRIGGELVLARYVGQAALSERAAAVAREAGLDTLVSGNRAMLADFFYTLRDSGLATYAEPVEGFPPHHYAQKHPLPPGGGDVLFVDDAPPECVGGVAPAPVAAWTPGDGYRRKEVSAWRVPRACWFGE